MLTSPSYTRALRDINSRSTASSGLKRAVVVETMPRISVSSWLPSAANAWLKGKSRHSARHSALFHSILLIINRICVHYLSYIVPGV